MTATRPRAYRQAVPRLWWLRRRSYLLFMLRERPLTLSEIAEGHSVDAPYATLIVDKLESLGLVVRQPHPDDKRRHHSDHDHAFALPDRLGQSFGGQRSGDGQLGAGDPE